jgi:putative ABC transport system permease protein
MEFYTVALLLGLAFVPLALGIFLSAKVFNIPDITTDGSFTLGAACFAVFILKPMHPILATLLVLPVGAIAGAATGVIHTKLKVNALLSGILVMTALYSVNLLIMERSNIPLIGAANIVEQVNNAEFLLKNMFIAVLIILMITALIIWLLKTDFGLTMRAAGSNENMIEAQGVNPDKIKVIGLAISNSLVALSGCLVTQLQGFADINMGIGIVISGLGSVMIGDTILGFVKNKSILLQLLAVVVGCIIFRLIIAAVLAIGLDPNYLKLLTSIIVLLFVAIGNKKIKLL